MTTTPSPAAEFPESAGAARPERSAIVTGGAGGIGSVIAARLARSGYRVVVADVDGARAKAIAEGLPGQGHRGFGGDLTSSAVNADLAATATGLAPIGAIVNAVGISPKREGRKIELAEIDDALFHQVMAVNVAAPFFLVREAAPLMPDDGSASVVNLLSIAGRTGTGGPTGAAHPPFLPSAMVYGASKAALANLTISLAHELSARRIRVNGVAPGFVQTPMMGQVPPAGAIVEQVPARRYARPEEVAAAVEFLLSAHASYITGTSIDVDGGWAPRA
ncbi:SDR family oxidoreductase [Streptomyces sp. SID10853]|uniref:SDR family NAD(P)-dependent oxidoreductase n=1 Tax=Streptomyces sp. SID10853 TaxID=2706028 RepID=UPI0013C207EE|nr:SDR family oxidoreductase [Streptomyces sp. SID10853]NDZ80870.1 SDR family oxidoreductase [Streptomyces sp. SID10853]